MKKEEIKKEIKRIEGELKSLRNELNKPEKPRTVRDLKYGDAGYIITLQGDISKQSKRNEYPYYLNFHLTEKEVQKRALRDRIECELKCDSVEAWGGMFDDIKRNEFWEISLFHNNKLRLGEYINWEKTMPYTGLFGAVNFPTKESLVESIYEEKKDSKDHSYCIHELMCEYFEVTDFVVV